MTFDGYQPAWLHGQVPGAETPHKMCSCSSNQPERQLFHSNAWYISISQPGPLSCPWSSHRGPRRREPWEGSRTGLCSSSPSPMSRLGSLRLKYRKVYSWSTNIFRHASVSSCQRNFCQRRKFIVQNVFGSFETIFVWQIHICWRPYLWFPRL